MREDDTIDLLLDSEKDSKAKTKADLDDLKSREAWLELREKEDMLSQRRDFAGRTFLLVSVYISLVLIIVVLCGFGALSISDAVLSTTIANVVGLLVIVMKYFFPALAKP